MRDNILLSVIVPIYNIKEYIDKCIASICEQRYKHLEIILVDDGSTDGCSQICDDYAERDPRIHVIHKENGGLVSARKAGAEAAAGEYVINVDGDDWIERERLQNLVNEIEKNSPDMVCIDGFVREYGETYHVTVNFLDIKKAVYVGREKIREFLENALDSKHFYTQKIPFTQWCWAVRRELYKKVQRQVDNRINMCEDVLCITACILESSKISCIADNSYHYIQRDNSIVCCFHTDELKLWYQQFYKLLEEHGLLERLHYLLNQTVMLHLLGANYQAFFKREKNYLFPFPEVIPGSRVILYGVGNLGTKIAQALQNGCENYNMVLWIDKNSGRMIDNYKISGIDEICKVEYDYIVIANIRTYLSEQIKNDLIRAGAVEDKIVLIDAETINNVKFPEGFETG